MHLVLSYFHKILGPRVFLAYPDASIEEEIINKLIKIFDVEIGETFFEIILINKKKRIINLYFELDSPWARGNKEMIMLSLIMKLKYDSRLIYSFLVDASHNMINTPQVYKAFYKNDDFHDNDIEIDLAHESIKQLLYECLSNLIDRLHLK